MSGTRNHIVPQFLQKGFAAQNRGPHQVWVYRKEQLPFKTSVANNAVQRKYYIDGDDRSVDDLMTRFEGRAASFVRQLRETEQSALLDRASIAEILVHLSTRSKYFRLQINSILNEFIDGISRYFLNSDDISRFLKSSMERNPELLTQLYVDRGLSDEQIDVANAWVGATLDSWVKKNSLQFSKGVHSFLSEWAEQLEKETRLAHLQVLKSDFDNFKLRKALLTLNYQVIRFSEPKLILPDSMVILLDRQKNVSPTLSRLESLDEVLFPLTSELALYGYVDTPVQRSLKTINRMLASCSVEHFIAQHQDSASNALRSRIGKNADFMSRHEVRRCIDKAVFNM